MKYAIVQRGESRSFPPGDSFPSGSVDLAVADVVIHLGAPIAPPVAMDPARAAVLVELASESLGAHVDDTNENVGNVLGFARYRNGADEPSKLVELVRTPATSDNAIAAARALFEAAGLTVVVCSDQPGRIIDRLVRPKYNAALRFLDEGLASAEDMDLTCRLGLGYPDGPIERVVRGGLAHHYDVTRALFETYGTAAFAPAPRAVAAARRRKP
jgi:3-hydroxybutyryl-CoA dehydrogenase